jgi:ABC-type glycerol-3-phosphate transport system substrate-binding protein
MRSSRRTFLKGAGAVAGAATLGHMRALRRGVQAAGKTTVTMWAVPYATASTNAALYDPWLAANAPKALPDVQIAADYGPGTYATMQSKYLVQAKSGTPDVIEGLLENIVAYIKAGDIAPLDDRFKNWADHAKFVPSAVNGMKYNGQLYGVPYNTNARGLLYRKSILKKYGLRVPTTWDELLNAAQAISAKEKFMAGVAFCTDLNDPRGAQEWLSWFFQLNPHLFKLNPTTKKWALNTTPAQIARVNQFYYNIFYGSSPSAANPGTLGINSYVEDPGYVSGLWAMVPMGPWLIGRRVQSSLAKYILEQDTGITSLPVAPGGKHGSYLEIKPWMLNTYSAHPDAAWEVIKFMASAQTMSFGVKLEGYIAPRLDVQSQPQIKNNWWTASFSDILSQGVALDPLNWAPVYTAIMTHLQSVIYKRVTPLQGATNLYNQLNQYLAQGVL